MFLLTALTMTAFAANSVLNRAAVGGLGMDPISFGAIRVVSGAVALAVLVVWQNRGFAIGGVGRIVSVGGLLTYIFGFSAAYGALDAGLGALILFGVVQVTMFGGALSAREVVPKPRWVGAGLALSGLAWLLWPSEAVPIPLMSAVAMAAAGVGWGIYSLQGKRETDATQGTAMNFLLASPIAALAALSLGRENAIPLGGLVLAVISGVVMSGAGYALWYALVPKLGAARAAVAQLTVPVIAMAGGMVFLSEPLSIRFVVASTLVLGGVLVSTLRA